VATDETCVTFTDKTLIAPKTPPPPCEGWGVEPSPSMDWLSFTQGGKGSRSTPPGELSDTVLGVLMFSSFATHGGPLSLESPVDVA
jgi:hypothetical protein